MHGKMTHDVEGETQVLMELSSDLTWSLTKQRRRVKTQKLLYKTLLPKIIFIKIIFIIQDHSSHEIDIIIQDFVQRIRSIIHETYKSVSFKEMEFSVTLLQFKYQR